MSCARIGLFHDTPVTVYCCVHNRLKLRDPYDPLRIYSVNKMYITSLQFALSAKTELARGNGAKN